MRTRALTLGSALFLVTAFFATAPAGATVHNIEIGNFFFAPTNTQVCPGDTVRWTWVGGFHSTTSEVDSPKSWNSGTSNAIGHTFEIEFLEEDGPGPFPYFCTVHAATMKDTIWIASDCAAPYVCGDADGSGEVDIDDVVFLIAYIFTGGPAPDPLESGDSDCSGGIDIDDVVYTIAYIFTGGAAPCADCA